METASFVLAAVATLAGVVGAATGIAALCQGRLLEHRQRSSQEASLREDLFLECQRGFTHEAEAHWLSKARSLGLGAEEIEFVQSYRRQLEALRVDHEHDLGRIAREESALCAKLKSTLLQDEES